MDDTDTATIELTRGEAREVINALSKHRVEVSGRDEERALNVREFLQEEFEFEDRHFEDDTTLVDAFVDIFDDGGDHEVQLSRAEAREVVAALTDLESDSSSTEDETIARLRNRFQERFDLDAGQAM